MEGVVIKKIFIILILLLFFISLSYVSAFELNGTEVNVTDHVMDFGDDKIISNYTETDNSTSLTIIHNSNRNMTLTYKNSNFKSFKIINGNNTDNSSVNINFINCKFIGHDLNSTIVVPYFFNGTSNSGNISDVLKVYTKSIVGNSVGKEAARKLAIWVGKNIKHETKEGFYQDPIYTLIRAKGNCASQTDLFLQMCAAAGVGKYCKMYYVHVGSYKFKDRHFFAMIDNLVVDVDSRPNNPWGHASINHNVTSIVPYPSLPLERLY